jgi:hypothetical protein
VPPKFQKHRASLSSCNDFPSAEWEVIAYSSGRVSFMTRASGSVFVTERWRLLDLLVRVVWRNGWRRRRLVEWAAVEPRAVIFGMSIRCSAGTVDIAEWLVRSQAGPDAESYLFVDGLNDVRAPAIPAAHEPL